MKRVLVYLAIITALLGFNIGFIRILVFLYRQWGLVGIWAGLTFVPPIIICPIWEWIVTGNGLTFLLVYVLGFGGLGLSKLLVEE